MLSLFVWKGKEVRMWIISQKRKPTIFIGYYVENTLSKWRELAKEINCWGTVPHVYLSLLSK